MILLIFIIYNAMNLIMVSPICPAATSSGPLGYGNPRLKEPVQQSFRIERLLSENAAEGEVACSMLALDASRKAADWSVDGEVELHGTSPSGGPLKQSRNQSTPGT